MLAWPKDRYTRIGLPWSFKVVAKSARTQSKRYRYFAVQTKVTATFGLNIAWPSMFCDEIDYDHPIRRFSTVIELFNQCTELLLPLKKYQILILVQQHPNFGYRYSFGCCCNTGIYQARVVMVFLCCIFIKYFSRSFGFHKTNCKYYII